jgi:hypothetical protein
MGLVRENSDGFRKESIHWARWLWNKPAEGDTFEQLHGWSPEPRRKLTVPGLSILEAFLKVRDQLPSTARLSVPHAERELWQALADGKLVAEALDANGSPTEIPQREWSYLKLFEERERDVLRHHALDSSVAFLDIKLKRDDLLAHWPEPSAYVPVEFKFSNVEPANVEPIASADPVGYVPLCAALHWIMTGQGTRIVALDDHDAWRAACAKLLPPIQTGEVELTGFPAGGELAERIPGHVLSVIRILSPADLSFSELGLEKPAHIACAIFSDKETWREWNDGLYVSGRPRAAWTHLQVRKKNVLCRWPHPTAQQKPELACLEWLVSQMESSRDVRLKSKDSFLEEARGKFKGLGQRQFHRAWDGAIARTGAVAWSKAGPPPRRSDHRTS